MEKPKKTPPVKTQDDIIRQMMNDLLVGDMLDMLAFYKKHDWIMGNSWVKRAFAFWGWTMAATGMIYGVIIIFAIITGSF